MIKGTKVIFGEDALAYRNLNDNLRKYLIGINYNEVIFPSLWDQETFIKKGGEEIVNQIYAFKDKGERPICLIPEVTALAQNLYNENWSRCMKKPIRIFYEARCYRYERPQTGRYREFTQFGVELMGGTSPDDKEEIMKVLQSCLEVMQVENFTINSSVKRGLSYYIEDGFEVEMTNLGAQKQIVGGGRYTEGIGFAIGIDRVLLSLKNDTV